VVRVGSVSAPGLAPGSLGPCPEKVGAGAGRSTEKGPEGPGPHGPRRSRWRKSMQKGKLFSGLGAFLLVCGLTAIASGPVLELDTSQEEFPLGGEAVLDVTIDPALVGGHGELYSQVEGESAEYVQSFSFSSSEFTIEAPVTDDPDHVGLDLEYWYEAFDLWESPWLTAWIIVAYFAGALVIDGFFRGAA